MSKQIPILFNGDMVRAILDGEKTQTRRPIKRPEQWMIEFNGKSHTYQDEYGDTCNVLEFSPFGKAGDVLWVRETFCEGYTYGGGDAAIYYKASNGDGRFKERISARCGSCNPVNPKWKPSIHMPKWACRTKLRVKRIWVERVQDITWEGARAEGIKPDGIGSDFADVEAFKILWNSIYGTWSDNPWVWACEFEVI